MTDFPPIRKAVFPVAGLGTRFLPATKSIPKEMLPIVDKPLIQYAVEEAVEAGVDTIIFVTSHKKGAILDHFDPDAELESLLLAKGNDELRKRIHNIIPDHVSTRYVIQEKALGLGHAVWCAKNLVGDEPFAVLLADDLIRSKGSGCLKQMVDEYHATGAGSLGVEEVPSSMTDRYGIVSVEKDATERNYIRQIVEKPSPENAPSNLGVVGRYILPGEIFALLESVQAGVGGEIQLTDAISRQLDSKPLLAHAFEGERYDCGSRHGFIRATVDYALEHEDLRDDMLAYFDTLRDLRN
ncbi:MAG: UTP--glucose-1-phosphate uridylyltransferase GalU [Xanthomonadales bacterium]|nr:UTP--glucose-1-phosphate uridylyltransferase GalU [Xanthomonadales bacterium]